MRIDYRKTYPVAIQATSKVEEAVHSSSLEPELLELVKSNGWNRFAVGLRSPVGRYVRSGP